MPPYILKNIKVIYPVWAISLDTDMVLGEDYYKGEITDNSSTLSLNPLEILILKCVKSKCKTEKKIAKQVRLNMPIASQLVTDLMMKGFIERTKKRRMVFSSVEYFSTTLEGLEALESATNRNNNSIFLGQMLHLIKATGQTILQEITTESLILKLILGTAKSVYNVAKFALK